MLQAATLGAPVLTLNVPAGHGVQVAAPWADQVPGWQKEHCTEPKLEAEVPASHRVQVDWPVNMLYEPRAQLAQVAALMAATVLELVPTGQAVQVAGPRMGL